MISVRPELVEGGFSWFDKLTTNGTSQVTTSHDHLLVITHTPSQLSGGEIR